MQTRSRAKNGMGAGTPAKGVKITCKMRKGSTLLDMTQEKREASPVLVRKMVRRCRGTYTGFAQLMSSPPATQIKTGPPVTEVNPKSSIAQIEHESKSSVTQVKPKSPVTEMKCKSTTTRNKPVPSVTEIKPKHPVTRNRPEPPVTELKSKPSVAEISSKPPVAQKKPKPPFTQNKSKLPVTGNKSKSPVTWIKSKSPVIQNKPESAVTHNKSESAVTRIKSKSPVTQNKSESALTQNKSKPPVTRNKSKPPVTQNKSEPPVTRDKSKSPVTRKKSKSPVTRKKSKSPVTRKKSKSPVTRDKSKSPVTRDKSESAVTRNKSESTVTRNKSKSPVTQSKFDVPATEVLPKAVVTQMEPKPPVPQNRRNPSCTQNKSKSSTNQIKLTPSAGQNVPKQPDAAIQQKSLVTQIIPKPPVWASVRQTRNPGKRKSLRLSGDAYDFSASPSKNGLKKRATRARTNVRKNRPKPRTKLVLLTTDPEFENKFPKICSSSGSVRDPQQSSSNPNCSLDSGVPENGNEPAPNSVSTRVEASSVESIDSDSDTGIDTHDEVFEGFEGETASSFVAPQPWQPKVLVPMTSINVVPTPVVSKHIAKFIGGSSTPRTESTVFSSRQESVETEIPRTIKDDIDICFGFESEPEAEAELSLSPVRRSGLQYSLEVTGASDVVEFGTRSVQKPSRFCCGARSNMSVSRSSNISARGRNVSSVSDASYKARIPLSVLQKNTLHKRNLEKCALHKRNDITKKDVENSSSIQKRRVLPKRVIQSDNHGNSKISNTVEDAEMSVLFDDEEAVENQAKVNDRQKMPPSANGFSDSLVTSECLSPEKSFSKVPRRSYNRCEVDEARKKFIKAHGGFVTETESDEEMEMPKRKPQKRKKTTKAEVPLKKRKKIKDKNSDASGLFSKSKKVKSKKSRKDVEFEKSLNDWASHLNSHFSEVEETFLIVT